MEVRVGATRIKLDPASSIGKGGEADVFDIGGRALKLFKAPDHPDFHGRPDEQEAARARAMINQTKLREYPLPLPHHVVQPMELVMDRRGRRVVGYTMQLIRGVEPLMHLSDPVRRKTLPNGNVVLDIFRHLHGTITGVHAQGVVIGDLNDLNVLVGGKEAYVIDADSFSFANFHSMQYTARFVDPLNCDQSATAPKPVRPHSASSDWYAFAVMLLECLLLVHPFGGIYQPSNPADRVPHDSRSLRRITVFSKDVRYPKSALPPSTLPDELLGYFRHVFEREHREPFPRDLLNSIRWTRCPGCGREHFRSACPGCVPTLLSGPAVTPGRAPTIATTVFRTSGVLLFAAWQGGALRWLYHEDGRFKREDGSTVTHGHPHSQMRYRLWGDATLIAHAGQLLTFRPGATVERLAVDSFGAWTGSDGSPVFDAGDVGRAWLHAGRLLRDGPFGIPEHVGNVLAGQTLFWMGPHFGFGFYHAGSVRAAFVFDSRRRGIKDTVALPPAQGQLFDALCVFGGDCCWFFTAVREGPRTLHRCVTIRSDGTVEGWAEAERGDGSWLGTLSGKAAGVGFLFGATDEGLVRLETLGGCIVPTRVFPDTAPYLNAGCRLVPAPEGVYVVDREEIRLLRRHV